MYSDISRWFPHAFVYRERMIQAPPLQLCGNYASKVLQFSRLISKAQKKTNYYRPHSCQNAWTSRAWTGRHSDKHLGQWVRASKICRSKRIQSLDRFDAEKTTGCGWINKPYNSEQEAFSQSKVMSSEKNIPRNQESSMMTLSHLLEQSDWSLLLPASCIRTFQVRHRRSRFTREPKGDHMHDPNRRFDTGSGRVYLIQKCVYGLKKSGTKS